VTAGGGQTDGQAQGLAPHLKQAPLSLVFSYLPHSYLLECQVPAQPLYHPPFPSQHHQTTLQPEAVPKCPVAAHHSHHSLWPKTLSQP
jgi:hypothetical protein